MRSLLALRIHTGPGVLDERRSFTQPSVVHDRYCNHTTSAVVGGEQALAGFVHCDVAGSGAARGDRVQDRELAGRGLDRITGQAATRLAFVIWGLVRRVKKFAVRMQREKRRVDGLGSKCKRAQLARRCIQPADVDPLAVLARIGADVYQVLARPGALLCARTAGNKEGECA